MLCSFFGEFKLLKAINFFDWLEVHSLVISLNTIHHNSPHVCNPLLGQHLHYNEWFLVCLFSIAYFNVLEKPNSDQNGVLFVIIQC
jgi:hypothetical protein